MGLCDTEGVLGTGTRGDEWTLGKKRQREDDAEFVGSKKAGGHFFFTEQARDLLRRTRENRRQVSMIYLLDGEG